MKKSGGKNDFSHISHREHKVSVMDSGNIVKFLQNFSETIFFSLGNLLPHHPLDGKKLFHSFLISIGCVLLVILVPL